MAEFYYRIKFDRGVINRSILIREYTFKTDFFQPLSPIKCLFISQHNSSLQSPTNILTSRHIGRIKIITIFKENNRA